MFFFWVVGIKFVEISRLRFFFCGKIDYNLYVELVDELYNIGYIVVSVD